MPAPRQPPVGRNLVNQRKNFNTSNQGKGLPKFIKCYVCKRDKSIDHYANAQIKRFQDTIQNPYAPSGRSTKNPKTTCKSCTPGQTQELFCIICNKTKGLDKFSKNQRDKPEKARCVKCVDRQLETEPDLSPPPSDYDSDSDDSVVDFDGGKIRIDNVRTVKRPDVRENSSQKANTGGGKHKAITNAAAYEDDDFDEDDGWADDGWVDVDTAGSVHKSQDAIQASSQIEDDSAINTTSTLVSSNRQTVPKNFRLPDPISHPPRHEGNPAPRNRRNNNKKWGASASTETDAPNEWADYARTMNARRTGGFQQAQQKKTSNDEDDGYDDEDWS